MTDREDLIHAVRELTVVRGRVTLASGKETDYYVDMCHVTLDGVASPLVERVMLELMADPDSDVVRGLALGADLVAIVMFHVRAAVGGQLDAFAVCKETKSYGLRRRIGGTDVTGRQVLVMEDTSTTDKSALTVVEVARRAGGEMVAMAVVVDHAIGAAKRVAEAGLEYRYAIELKELSP